jgi:hypothetical protein
MPLKMNQINEYQFYKENIQLKISVINSLIISWFIDYLLVLLRRDIKFRVQHLD